MQIWTNVLGLSGSGKPIIIDEPRECARNEEEFFQIEALRLKEICQCRLRYPQIKIAVVNEF